MFCPYKIYELPRKEEINGAIDFLEKHKYYKFPIKTSEIGYIFKKSIIFPLIDLSICTNTLGYTFNKEKEFEYKCEQIFNLGRFTVKNGILRKEDNHTYANSSVQIPISKLKDCSGYSDFVLSLNNIGVKFVTFGDEKDSTGIIMYNIKSKNLSIFDEYKP